MVVPLWVHQLCSSLGYEVHCSFCWFLVQHLGEIQIQVPARCCMWLALGYLTVATIGFTVSVSAGSAGECEGPICVK